MVRPRELSPLMLIPLLLSLAFTATALIAQPAADDPTGTATGSQQDATGSGETPPPAAPEDSQDNGRENSPFDYLPSEEISEDLPVSFPVDI